MTSNSGRRSSGVIVALALAADGLRGAKSWLYPGPVEVTAIVGFAQRLITGVPVNSRKAYLLIVTVTTWCH